MGVAVDQELAARGLDVGTQVWSFGGQTIGATDASEVMLARGLWRQGRRHRRALLRDLDADGCRQLLDTAGDMLPAERITAVLTAWVRAIGGVTTISAEEVRDLSIGDRDRLVLAVRQMLHADALECVFSCNCGEVLELSLDAGALLRNPDPMPDGDPVTTAGDSDEASAGTAGQVRLRVRPANGADHERASRRALEDREAARRELVAACITEARTAGGAAAPIDDEIMTVAEQMMAELDPASEITLSGDCPACGETVTVLFDPITHLWAELERWRARLEQQIHLLALHYHWSEREIVAFSPAQRDRYLAQLERSLVTA